MFISDQVALGKELDQRFCDAGWEFYCENGTKRDGLVYICFCWGF